MLEFKKIGSLVIEEEKHLQEYSGASLQYFSKTLRAGQLGRLLGKFRKQESIPIDKILLFAADLEIYDSTLLFDSYLPQLERLGSINTHRDSSGKIIKIEEYIESEQDVLELTGEIWTSSEPSEIESSSLDLVKLLMKYPMTKSEVVGEIEGLGYHNPELNIELTATFDIIQKHEISGIFEPVYHTPYFARENTTKMIHAMKGFNPQEIEILDRVLDTINENQAMPLSQIKEQGLSEDTLLKCEQTGIIDVAKVESESGNCERFLFTSAMWNPFGRDSIFDEQEHVKELLSCVRFGQFCPSEVNGHRYPIKYPERYLGALIRDGEVGSSTMIGRDYLILAREGIVNIVPTSPDGFYKMELVKEDVAIRAKRIISSGQDISLDVKQGEILPMSDATNYGSPIHDRIVTSVKFKKTSRYRSELINKNYYEIIRGER